MGCCYLVGDCGAAMEDAVPRLDSTWGWPNFTDDRPEYFMRNSLASLEILWECYIDNVD